MELVRIVILCFQSLTYLLSVGSFVRQHTTAGEQIVSLFVSRDLPISFQEVPFVRQHKGDYISMTLCVATVWEISKKLISKAATFALFTDNSLEIFLLRSSLKVEKKNCGSRVHSRWKL